VLRSAILNALTGATQPAGCFMPPQMEASIPGKDDTHLGQPNTMVDRIEAEDLRNARRVN
jgi:hypothetical protein